MTSKINLIFKGSSFRVLQTFVSIVIGILMMPFLVSTLGTDLYGLWVVIGSVVGSYYLLDMGFNQAVTRYVTTFIHQNDSESANKIINTALFIYSLLGLAVLLVSVVAAQYFAQRLMGSSDHLSLAKIILMVMGLSFALEFPSKAFPGIISAYMRYDFIAIVRFVKNIADALLIYCFLSMGYGLIAMALIVFTTSLMSTLVYIRFTTGLFKEIRFGRRYIQLSTFKEVFHFSKWVFVIDVMSLIRDKMDIWFISFYINNASLTIYYVAVRLTEYALQFLTQATSITGPIFTEYYVKGELDKLAKSVRLFIKIDLALGVLVIVGFALLGGSFIEIWMKGSIPTEEALACLVILSMGRFSVYFASPLNSLLLTINKHHLGAWLSLIETAFAALLCWFLVPVHGIVGAAFSIAVPFVVGRLICMPIISSRFIDLHVFSMATRFLLFLALSIFFVLAARWSLPQLSHLDFLHLLLFAPLIVVIQLIISLALLSVDERLLLVGVIKQKLGSFTVFGVKKCVK